MYPPLIVQAAVIDWFSRLFIAPLDVKILQSYRTPSFTDFLTDLGEILGTETLISTIIKILHQQPIPDLEQTLSHHYILFFDGCSGPNTIPLCESFYGHNHSHLFQKPCIEMDEILKALDVSIINTCKEPADHLALELAALAEALGQQNILFIKKIYTRLSGWVPQINTAIHHITKTSFYTKILELLVIYFSSFNHLIAQGKKTFKF